MGLSEKGTMRAWRIAAHGGPEALRRETLPVPLPGPGQVLIEVAAVGLNHLDVWVRRGVPGHTFPLPLTPGCDMSGTIREFGQLTKSSAAELTADGLEVGTDVIIDPILSCGRCRACLTGREPICRHFGILGEHADGGAADFVVVNLANLVRRPTTLTPTDAASLSVAWVTAWSMVKKARLAPGDLALVQAGGSGVGVALVQLLKMSGVSVVTTVSTPKIERARAALGAEVVINSDSNNTLDAVRAFARERGRKGVQAAFDHVGAATFATSVRALDWGGRLLVCGATVGSQVTLDLKPLFFKNLEIIGSTMGSRADLREVIDLIAAGRARPMVESILPMSDLPSAMQLLEDRKVFGKVVVVN